MLPQCIQHVARCLLLAPFVGCWLLVPAASHAVTVEIQSAPQVVATADFRPGKAGKPAILVLHGFLQTRDFGVVRSIADTFSDEGYTVLSPNLSLGIPHRKSSLDCEALHLHDMGGDIGEIQQWVQWLRGRGHTRIFGVGHSFGATQLVAWREKYREKDFGLIGVSMIGSAPFTLRPKSYPSMSPTNVKQPDSSLVHAPLSFCETYSAPANKYASYHQWNENRTLAALKRFGTRTDVILGSEDKFAPSNWENQLAKTGARIHKIRGANHFMGGTQEFDMLDTILGILKQ